jgi:hypothetical protein
VVVGVGAAVRRGMTSGVSPVAVAVVVALTAVERALFEVFVAMAASTADPEKAWAPSWVSHRA